MYVYAHSNEATYNKQINKQTNKQTKTIAAIIHGAQRRRTSESEALGSRQLMSVSAGDGRIRINAAERPVLDGTRKHKTYRKSVISRR